MEPCRFLTNLKQMWSVYLKTRSEAAWTVRRIPALDGAVTSAAMGTPFNVFRNFKKAVTSPYPGKTVIDGETVRCRLVTLALKRATHCSRTTARRRTR
jgi:hypothetical protein